MDELQQPYEYDMISFENVSFDEATRNLESGQDDTRMTADSAHGPAVIDAPKDSFAVGSSAMVSPLELSAGCLSQEDFVTNLDGGNHGHTTDDSSALARAETSTGQAFSQEKHSSRDLDSHCVLACTEIISNLENYILADLKALDLCLAIVRQTVDELSRLVDTQQASRNFRCMALFSVIMYQMIELLEAGCTVFLVENQDGTGKVVPEWLRKGCTPGIGFGAFRMGASEQRAWRRDIVLKELRQSSEVLQKIIALARLGPRQACRGTPEDRAACYSELEGRFAALREKFGDHE